MCSRCCALYCSCNTTCCFGFIIPVPLGTVFAACWVLFNGLTFPAMSLLFWPEIHVLIPCCVTCLLVTAFVVIVLANMALKRDVLMKVGTYGTFASYALGCLMVIVGLNVNSGRSVFVFVKRLNALFDVTISERTGFQMLQSIQIMYYTYLFFSYVYCGVVFQLFGLKYIERQYKKRRKTPRVVVVGEVKKASAKPRTEEKPSNYKMSDNASVIIPLNDP